jgi:hypothetical protein
MNNNTAHTNYTSKQARLTVPEKNRWIWIPIFIVLVFLGDRIGGYILMQLESTSNFRFTRLYHQKAACDILIAGNSRGLSFYQPFVEKKSNKKVFSLAYNGMSSSLGHVFIEDYFENYPAPEKLILEVTCADRYNKELVPAFACYTPYSNHLKEYIKEKEPKTYYATKVSHLLRYNSEVFQRSLRYLKNDDRLWLTDRTISEAMQHKSTQLKNISIDLIPELQSPLAATVKLAQSKGTEVILIVAPFLPNYYDALYNLDDYIDEVEKNTGLKVYNYGGAIQDPKLFGDYFHLNVFGSEQFVSRLHQDQLF